MSNPALNEHQHHEGQENPLATSEDQAQTGNRGTGEPFIDPAERLNN